MMHINVMQDKDHLSQKHNVHKCDAKTKTTFPKNTMHINVMQR